MIAVGLLVVACASPLLTFSALFQQKEWRTDRLREHAVSEGMVATFFGRIRPVIAVAILLFNYIMLFLLHGSGGEVAAFFTGVSFSLINHVLLGFLAALTGVQWLLGKQRTPVWTQKACLLVGLAFLLLIAISLLFGKHLLMYYPLLLVLQPLVVLLAWVLLLPLDMFLKRRILSEAARIRRKFRMLTVIALTGSVGKTTTKELLRSTLQSSFPVVTPAYVNSELGVAQWFLSEVKKGAVREGGVVVVEMGAYRTGEVALLCRIMLPTMGIVTSVGTQHIALFGSMEKILESEREMPSSLPPDGLLLLNADVPDCRNLASAARCKVQTVGTIGDVDIRATDITHTEDGLHLQVEKVALDVPLHGRQNVTNILLAYAAARQLNVRPEEIARQLSLFPGQRHTFHVRAEHGVLLLDDTHNLSPQSIVAGIEWANEQQRSTKILCITGLIEQGAQEDAEMERAGSLAKNVFSRVLFAGTRGRSAFQKGYGGPVESLSTEAAPIAAGSLVACLGRIPLGTVHRLLP